MGVALLGASGSIILKVYNLLGSAFQETLGSGFTSVGVSTLNSTVLFPGYITVMKEVGGTSSDSGTMLSV